MFLLYPDYEMFTIFLVVKSENRRKKETFELFTITVGHVTSKQRKKIPRCGFNDGAVALTETICHVKAPSAHLHEPALSAAAPGVIRRRLIFDGRVKTML